VLDSLRDQDISSLSVDNFVDSFNLKGWKPCKSRACLKCPQNQQKTKSIKINHLQLSTVLFMGQNSLTEGMMRRNKNFVHK